MSESKPDKILVVARDAKFPLSPPEAARFRREIEDRGLDAVSFIPFPIDIFQRIDGRWEYVGPKDPAPAVSAIDEAAYLRHLKGSVSPEELQRVYLQAGPSRESKEPSLRDPYASSVPEESKATTVGPSVSSPAVQYSEHEARFNAIFEQVLGVNGATWLGGPLATDAFGARPEAVPTEAGTKSKAHPLVEASIVSAEIKRSPFSKGLLLSPEKKAELLAEINRSLRDGDVKADTAGEQYLPPGEIDKKPWLFTKPDGEIVATTKFVEMSEYDIERLATIFSMDVEKIAVDPALPVATSDLALINNGAWQFKTTAPESVAGEAEAKPKVEPEPPKSWRDLPAQF